MKISVYITSYNQKEFLKVAIDSVLNQTLKPFEIIIVDDASTDGSQDVIRLYQNGNPNIIKYYFNERNLGITKSRNIALSLVAGDLVTWLDGDDKYLPNKIELQVAKLTNTDSDLVYSNFYYSSTDLATYDGIWCENGLQLPKDNNIFFDVIARNFPNGTLFRYEMVKAKLLESVGGYDQNLAIYEDFDFRIRLCENAKTCFNMEPLSVYRLHEEGLSRAPAKLHLESLQYIYEKYRPKLAQLPQEKRQSIEDRINLTLEQFKKGKPIKKSLFFRIINKIKKAVRL